MSSRLIRPLEGDVLLSRGTKAVSRLIMRIDGAPVSHASLLVGGGEVVEAVAPRVVRRPLEEAAAHADGVLARRLAAPGLPLDPVVARALAFAREGRRYGYEQVLLLAFLGLSRRLEVSPGLKALLRGLLDGAAGWLLGLAHRGQAPLICSELVYRCFDEAEPAPSRYALDVGQDTPRGARPGGRPLRAATARPRGVEAGALLDLLAGARPRGSLQGAARPVIRTGAALEAEVERLARVHLDALGRAARGRALAPRRLSTADAVELQPAVRAFAEAWAAAARAGPGAGVERGLAARPPLALLRRAVAELVTPGDLLHSRSLADVGWVKGRPLGGAGS